MWEVPVAAFSEQFGCKKSGDRDQPIKKSFGLKIVGGASHYSHYTTIWGNMGREPERSEDWVKKR
jgi:hypothetical protein